MVLYKFLKGKLVKLIIVKAWHKWHLHNWLIMDVDGHIDES